jgi:cytochrome bd ubiquinol oxidase subunit II
MDFALVWFTLVTLLWTGFFVLEGFDFGVGMLHGLVGRTDPERRLAIGSIGPLWDGNEVWLIVAGASMFAAFPGWYATMFSGFYPALILLLAALIVRGVSFEYRGRRESPRWRRNWTVLLTAGSLLAPLLIGVALGDLLHGVPIDSSQEYTGGLVDLLTPYGLYVGVTVTVLAALHGSTFLVLKVADPVRGRSHALGRVLAPVAAALVLGFVVWTQSLAAGWVPGAVPVLAAVAAAVFLPLVLLYQGWTYYVFRRRLTLADVGEGH